VAQFQKEQVHLSRVLERGGHSAMKSSVLQCYHQSCNYLPVCCIKSEELAWQQPYDDDGRSWPIGVNTAVMLSANV
jgi:hypothetical protein